MRKVYYLFLLILLSWNARSQTFGTPETRAANNTTATAQSITSPAKVRANLFPAGDIDVYSFTANAGDRVYAAVMTSFSAGNSTDCQLTLLASDGTTIIEFDDDNGSFAPLSSSISGAIIPTSGTYYLKVNDFTPVTTSERGYDLYLKVQSGSPTAEVESNDAPGSANLLPVSGWVSGARNPAAATEQDWYSVNLTAGQTVFLSLDLDPEKDGVTWNGRLGFGLFGDATNQILVVDDAGTGDVSPNPNRPSEAMFFTVKETGTYFLFIDAASAATGGATATYHASLTVYNAETGYVNTPSIDIPKTIGPGTGSVTSTLTIPGNPRIKDISVRLQLNHALMQDIDATLTTPQGNIIHLFTDIGAAATGGQSQMDMFLNDYNGVPAGTYTVLKGTGFQPEVAGKLDQLKNMNAGGVWTLTLYDDAANASGGTLTGWSLDIMPEPEPDLSSSILIFDADFETGDNGFTHSGTADEWERGTPATLATTTTNPVAAFTTANSGVNCWKTDLDNTYSINSSQTLRSPSIALPATASPLWLSWAMKYQMESANFDQLTVVVQQVGNPASAVTLFDWLGGTQTAAVGNPAVNVPQSSGWGTWFANVSAFAGQNVEFLVTLTSDNTVVFGGVAIDDVKVYQVCNPPAITTNPTSVAVCAGATVTFTAAATGTVTYQWQVDNGGGFVNIPSETNPTLTFTALASQSGYLYRCVATNSVGCGSATTTAATLTVNAAPVLSGTTVEPTTCISADGSINLTVSGTATGPFTYSWSTTNGSGLVNGQEDQTNLTVGSYTVTVTSANTCSATTTFNLVGPGGCFVCPTIGAVSTSAGSGVCLGSNVTFSATGLTGMSNVYGITFKYSASALADPYTGGTVLGTVANGSLTGGGTTATFTGSIPTAGSYYIYAIVSPTPIDPVCRPSSQTTLFIAPTTSVNPVTNLVVCNGANTPLIPFTGGVAGTTYSWTNNNTSIGLAANGTGDIASFLANNTGAVPATATVTVTPSVTTTNTTSATFNYSGSIQNWVVPAGITSVRIEARGAEGGFNPSSTATPGKGAIMAGDFTVVPGSTLKILVGQQPTNTSGNGGGGGTFVTDVANSPLIIAGGGGGSSQGNDSPDKHGQITTTGGTGAGGGGTGGTAGNGGNIGASGFQSGAGGGLLTNGADGWTSNSGGLAFVNGGSGGTVNAPANGGFGGGGSGSSYVVGGGGGGYSGGGSGGNTTAGVGGGGGSYNAGTNQNNIGGPTGNSGNGSVIITYAVGTPVTCTGTPQTFTITVNPTPTVDAVANQTVCNGASTTAVSFSGAVAGTVYNWTNNTPSIGLPGSGTGNIGSFNAVNTGTTPVTATITVTPSYTNGATTCTGTPTTFTITVNPTPTVNAVSNQTVCNGANTAAVNFTGAVAGTVYNWTNNTPSIGLAGSGTGNIAAFPATNTGTTPVTATITVTPSYTNGATTCTGTPQTFTITVNPTAAISVQPANTAACTGQSATFAVTATGVSLTYQWQVNTGSGFNNITNGSPYSGATTATLTINPAAAGLNGNTYRVVVSSACGSATSNAATLTVNPLPTVSVGPSGQCSPVTLTATGNSNTYSWSPALGLNTTTGATVIATTNATITYTVTGTITATGCTNTATATVLGTPPPVVVSPANPAICAGTIQQLTVPGGAAILNSAGTITIPFGAPGTTSGPANPYPSSITAVGLPTSGVTVKSVTINGITHPFPDDLDILLQSPTGQNVVLMSDAGGSNALSNVNYTFDDAASSLLSDAGANAAGTYRPSNFGATDTWVAPGPGSITQATPTLSTFTGNPNGNWGLYIVDDATGNVGSIANWSITFNIPTATWTPATGLFINAAGTIPYTAGTLVNTVYANPANTTTYTVTGTMGSCSVPSGTVTVTVNPRPTISVTPNNQCGPVTLTASGTSNTYSWSPATGLSATTGATVTANPTVNTTYTVTGTITATGCTNTATVTVNATPTAPVVTPSAMTICRGATTTLTSNTPALWSPATGLFTNPAATAPYVAGTYAQIVYAAPTTTTTYSATVASSTSSCVSTAATSVVTVLQPLSITTQPANQTVCVGANATFSVVAAGSQPFYQWQLSTDGGASWTNIANANGASLVVSNTTAAMNGYRYRVIITNTCTTVTSNAAILTVNTLTTVTVGALPASICLSDAPLTLTGSPVGGSWSGIGVSGNTFVPAATAVGTYTLTYTYANTSGCTGTATVVARVVDCQDRNILLRDGAVQLYPNPNNGQFNLRIVSTLYNRLGMTVYNSKGQVVRTQEFSGLVYGRVLPVDLTDLPGAVYMVKLYYDDGVRTSEKTFKVIVAK